jgi:membrane carboxypeptidase/penicillin-binding protein
MRVRGGTGQRVGRELAFERDGVRIPVPAYGKTGTTNDYRNAAFLGYIAAPADGGFDPAAGYAIGVYTGFDDNRPMTRAGIRGTGATMALPAWLDIAKGIVKIGRYADQITRPEPSAASDTGLAALSEEPLYSRMSQYKPYRVSRRTGLPLTGLPEDSFYAEDLSDELGPDGNAETPGPVVPLWIRESGED